MGAETMSDRLARLHREITECVHGTGAGGNRAAIAPLLLSLTDDELTGLLTYLHGDDLAHVRAAATAILNERMTKQSTEHMTGLKDSIVSLMTEIDESGKKATKAAHLLAGVGLLVALVEVLVAVGFLPRIGGN